MVHGNVEAHVVDDENVSLWAIREVLCVSVDCLVAYVYVYQMGPVCQKNTRAVFYQPLI